jgi:hypothetical protein
VWAQGTTRKIYAGFIWHIRLCIETPARPGSIGGRLTHQNKVSRFFLRLTHIYSNLIHGRKMEPLKRIKVFHAPARRQQPTFTSASWPRRGIRKKVAARKIFLLQLSLFLLLYIKKLRQRACPGLRYRKLVLLYLSGRDPLAVLAVALFYIALCCSKHDDILAAGITSYYCQCAGISWSFPRCKRVDNRLQQKRCSYTVCMVPATRACDADLLRFY